MHFTKTFVLSLLGLASAAPVNKRTAATIESDITSISSELSTVDSDVDAFTGSLLQGLTLLVAIDSLESDIKTATSDVTSTGTLSASDSATIYTAVSSLATKVATVLTDVIAKASTVSSSGYTSEVLSAVKTLQSETDAFFTALEATIDSSYTSEVTTLQTSVDSEFASAIAAY